MKRRGLRAFAVLSALFAVLVAWATPASAYADELAVGDGQAYSTLDEAVAAASDGDTIVLYEDATTAGLNLSKDLTIQGASSLAEEPTVTFTQYGIALWGTNLTFKDCNVQMNGIGSTPYTAEWNWMSICASKDATLTLDNVDMTMDATGVTNNPHAIYFCNNNVLNIKNNSELSIKNYPQDALEWDGGDGGYNINITDSKFVSDHNRSGFTGTLIVTIERSDVEVIDSTGNGSNGSHFDIEDESTVDFSNNGSHGLSAGNLYVKDSEITATNNGMCGVIFTGQGTFANADVTITGTKGTSYWNAGMRLYTSNATATVDENSSITITDNDVTGLFLDTSSDLTIAEGADVLITRNNASQENCSTYRELAQEGGGLVVRSGAEASLSSTTEIYNNHAAVAGDDIFLESDTSSIKLGATGSGWVFDCTDSDCTGGIDGWYDDSADNRWEAHAGDNNHAKLFTDNVNEDGALVAVTGALALKAAHGVTPATVTLTGTKTLEGRTLQEGEFSFELVDESSETAQTIQTVSNAADGSFSFGELTFDASKASNEGETYNYVIREVIPDEATANIGDEEYTYKEALNDDSIDEAQIASATWTLNSIQYDARPVNVTVTAKHNKTNASVKTTVAYSKNDEPVEDATFTNIYAPDAVVADGFVARKVLEGTDLEAGQFTFELKDAEGNVVQTATNEADGTVRFSGISFTAEGQYDYTISEVNDGQENITYDDSVKECYVEVADNNGTLTAETYAVDTPAEEELVFTNTYTGDDATAQTGDASDGTGTAAGSLVQTSDSTPLVIAGLAVAGAACLGAALVAKKRSE